MLEINIEHLADIAFVRCYGRIVAGAEAESLKDAVAREADKRLVIVDLGGVDAIDARGLGLLVFLQTLSYALGFDLQITRPAPRVAQVFDLTRLDSVLEITRPEGAEEPSRAQATA